MKIRLVGAELFNADGRMGGQKDGRMDRHDEANSHFSIFSNKPEN
jgi:hypothetical protein